MSDSNTSPFARLRIIYLFLVLGSIASCAVLYFLRQMPAESNSSMPLLIAGATICFPALFLLFVWSKRKAASDAALMTNHLIAYSTAEGAALANMMAYYIGGDTIHVVFAGLMVGAMIVRYPKPTASDGVDLRSGGSFKSGEE